jgi:hypothetical protein
MIGTFPMDNVLNNDTRLIDIPQYLKVIGMAKYDCIGSRERRISNLLILSVKAIQWGWNDDVFEQHQVILKPGTVDNEISEYLSGTMKSTCGQQNIILVYIANIPQRIDCHDDTVHAYHP